MNGLRGTKRLTWALGLLLTVVLGFVFDAVTAPAQSAGRSNFFEFLFGGQPQPPVQEIPVTPRKVKRSDYVPSTTTRAPGTPGGAPAQAIFHVQVLGDTLALEANDGLVEAFADKPEIGFVNKARDASGLVRVDYYDCLKYAADAAKAPDKPDFVFIMVGVNDGQQMRDGADWLDSLSDKWLDRYGQRVEAIVAPFVAQHIPVVWVGLPPMRGDRFNTLANKLNEVDRAHAEKAGAKFIDIHDAFADEDGAYDAFGPSIEGQNVKLRASDGIHFTKAGARKVAHFVEGDIRRAFEKRNPASDVAALPPDIEHEADDINAQIRREMNLPTAPTPPGAPAAVEAPAAPPPPPQRPLAGPILPLTGRPVSPGGALASRETHPLAEPADVIRVMRAGEPVKPAPGRADDFSWPRL